MRARELWRVPEPYLAEAQDDATILAISAQEDAGLDIVTDGEIRRESYSNRFATALEGVDIDNPGTALDRSGPPQSGAAHHRQDPAQASGRGRRPRVPEAPHRAHVKITVPGPFTMSQQAQNDFYPSDEAAAMDYAVAVNAEIKDLFAAGADVVQIDEPYMQARPAKAEEYGLKALERALDGVAGTTAVHICFGYAAIIHQRPSGYSFLGQLKGCSCRQVSLETAQSQSRLLRADGTEGQEDHARRDRPQRHERRDAGDRRRAHPPRAALSSPPRTSSSRPDCGMKYLPREVAVRQDAGDGRGRGDHARRTLARCLTAASFAGRAIACRLGG